MSDQGRAQSLIVKVTVRKNEFANKNPVAGQIGNNGHPVHNHVEMAR